MLFLLSLFFLSLSFIFLHYLFPFLLPPYLSLRVEIPPNFSYFSFPSSEFSPFEDCFPFARVKHTVAKYLMQLD
jgi:hypothetical protein